MNIHQIHTILPLDKEKDGQILEVMDIFAIFYKVHIHV